MKRTFFIALACIAMTVGCKTTPSDTADSSTSHSDAKGQELTDAQLVAYAVNQQNDPLPALGDIDALPVEEALLLDPPNVPPPIERRDFAKVVVNLEVIEKTMEIAEGVNYTYWTFGGTVPGPMIRVRRGDLIEFHLMNHPDNTMPHNIDLHAVTGPGGGATSSFTAPGRKTQFTFRALQPGVFIYHCATAPVGMHIANGMYGLIVVEPEHGYPEVDKEFYVLQSEFYTPGDYRSAGHQPFDMERAIDEDPSYVVFNGADKALVGEGKTLQADVGDVVRLFVGNAGPNLSSSFHIIGEIFDRVWIEGASKVSNNVQTTLIPAGGAVIVEFKLDVPGTYVLVDHAIFRAFNKGALGLLEAIGEPNLEIYTGLEVDEVYLGDYSPKSSALLRQAEAEDAGGDSLQATILRGESVYQGTCSTCHMLDGKGMKGIFPPLANSDYLMEDKERSIRISLEGLSGPITVNGEQYDNFMPGFKNLNDREISAVLTYIRSSFGNDGDAVTPEEVAKVRAALPAKPASSGHP